MQSAPFISPGVMIIAVICVIAALVAILLPKLKK
jgi:hypothetical protein